MNDKERVEFITEAILPISVKVMKRLIDEGNVEEVVKKLRGMPKKDSRAIMESPEFIKLSLSRYGNAIIDYVSKEKR